MRDGKIMNQSQSEKTSATGRTVIQSYDELCLWWQKDYEEHKHLAGKYTGVPSGFGGLDQLTWGFQRGEMAILAARTSMGKTALASQMMVNMVELGHKVAYFTLELKNTVMFWRLLSQLADVPFQNLRSYQLSEDHIDRLQTAMGKYYGMNRLTFIEGQGVTLAQMRALGQDMAKSGHEILFVDFLSLLRTSTEAQKNERIGEVSKYLRWLSLALSLPIVALSQLNRAAGQGEPGLENIRWSGEIEEDADLALLLYLGSDKIHRLKAAKNRNGPTGEIKLRFDGPRMSFTEVK